MAFLRAPDSVSTSFLSRPKHTGSSTTVVISPRIGARLLSRRVTAARPRPRPARVTTVSSAEAPSPPPGHSSNTPDSSGLRGAALLREDVKRLVHRIAHAHRRPKHVSFRDFPRYDPMAIAEYFDARPFAVARRALEVGVPFGVWFAKTKLAARISRASKAQTQARAEELRAIISSAGATIIKLGQAASSRPDLVSPAYIAELQKLTDDVGAFDSATARTTVCEDLGITDVNQIFSNFSVEPIASASLGQVHKARLRTGGAHVAVKVQRPFIRELAALDVYLLRRVAGVLKQRLKLRSDIVGIVDEFATRLWEEVDYLNEASNAERFRQYFVVKEPRSGVYIPRVYRDYSSRRVLVMEWVDGDKPPWSPKDDAKKLIAVGVRCSLTQLLGDFALVHGDQHAGNVLRGPNGDLILLDFGMCVDIDRRTRINLIRAITHLINRQYDELALDFVRLGFLPDGSDHKELIPKLQKAFIDAQGGADRDGLSELSFGDLANNLSELAYTSPIRIPVAFTILIRALTILEGLALQQDPDFKIVDAAYPFVVGRLLDDDAPELQEALEGALVDERGRLRWGRLEAVLQVTSSKSGRDERGAAAEQSGNPLDDAFPSSPRRWARGAKIQNPSGGERVRKFILSPRGAFLREALAKDLADIMDSVQLDAAARVSEATRGVLPRPTDTPDPEQLRRSQALLELLRSGTGSGPRRSGPCAGARDGGLRELQRGSVDRDSVDRGGTSERVRRVLELAVGVGQRDEQMAAAVRRIAVAAAGEVADRNARRAIRMAGSAVVDALLGPSTEAARRKP